MILKKSGVKMGLHAPEGQAEHRAPLYEGSRKAELSLLASQRTHHFGLKQTAQSLPQWM
jgi:hypothetical protein